MLNLNVGRCGSNPVGSDQDLKIRSDYYIAKHLEFRNECHRGGDRKNPMPNVMTGMVH